MTDIVERLRRYHKDDEPPTLYDEAAAEIERLWMQLADHGETITRLQEQLTVVRELRDCDMREIERLNEQVAALQAASGYEASIAQVEIERLTAWLQEIAREQDATDADYFRAIARAALAGQPLAGKERKP